MPLPDRPSGPAAAISDEELAAARSAFGDSVRRSRRARRLSQERLAHDVGLHPSMVGRVERGEVAPSLDTMLKISRGLGTELVELFDGVEERGERGKRG